MNYNFKGVLFPVLLFLVVFHCAAQTGDIRGFVYDKNTGEPVIFTNVYLENTTLGGTTDINGFYAISNVTPGDYTVVATFIGYDTAKVAISVKPGKIITQKLYIAPQTRRLQGVEVSAERQEAKNEVQISTTKISLKNIEKLPGIGGESDIAQYMQILPGVVFSGDQGGQLYVRGGPPVQTKMLLDGVTIYNPFHSIGLFSVIESDFIKNVDVMTGGFSADYGGRISAIVDIATKDGNKNELDGKVSANPFIAKALLEGPIMKLKDNGSSATFLLSYKNSYLDKTSPFIYSHVDKDGIPYKFSDYYGKFSFNASTGSKINFFVLHDRDHVDFLHSSQFNWTQTGVGSNFVVVPGQSNTLISGNFSYSKYGIDLTESDGKPRNSSVSGFNIGMEFTYFLTHGELKYGVDINGFKTVFEFFNALDLKIDQNQNTTELGAYITNKQRIGKLILQPGLRLQYYASLNNFSLEPRFGMKYNVTDEFRLKIAGGIYSQNLISTKSDRDVVNLFTGYLSGPEEQLYDIDGKRTKNNIQKALHAIGGAEFDLLKHIRFNAEYYYYRFTQLININRNKQFESDPNYMVENGNATGLDLLVKYDYKRWFLWLSYSLGYVERNDGRQVYSPHFDRRHNLNFVASYTFGKDLNWEASLRWNIGSGFPFTKTQGFYEQLNFSNGINTNYTTDNGMLGILYDSDLNTGRLPYYHRLDLSLKAKFALTTETMLEVIASVTNAYNRENIFYFDRVHYERVNQLPVLPSLGIAVKF